MLTTVVTIVYIQPQVEETKFTTTATSICTRLVVSLCTAVNTSIVSV